MAVRGSIRRRTAVAVVVTVLAVAVVVAAVFIGTSPEHGSTGPGTGRGVADVGPPPPGADFSRPVLTWAQDSTLHYGRRTLDLSPWIVRGLAPSSYGMFAEVVRTRGPDAVSRWVLFDGRRVRPLSHHQPDDVTDVVVSPDGRYVGWVDFHGPRRTWGHAAKIVVRDLGTDRTVFETSAGMGGNGDQDLYGDSPPVFLGFDDDHAYWVDAKKQDRWRWNLTTHTTQHAQKPHDGALIGHPVDPRQGREAGLDGQGRLVPDPTPYDVVHLSPGATYYRDGNEPSLRVTATGRRVRLAGAGRFLSFAAWRDDTSFYALSAPRQAPYVGENGPHPITGRLVSCSLVTSRCTTLRRVVGIGTVVTPGSGQAGEG